VAPWVQAELLALPVLWVQQAQWAPLEPQAPSAQVVLQAMRAQQVLQVQAVPVAL